MSLPLPFLLAGHSHAYSLGLPGAARDASASIVEISEGFHGLVGGWPRSDQYWDALAAAAPDYVILLSFLGNEHLAHFLVEDQPFDVIPVWALQCETSGARLVPESMVREVFRGHRTELPKVLATLHHVGARTYVLGTPPPKK